MFLDFQKVLGSSPLLRRGTMPVNVQFNKVFTTLHNRAVANASDANDRLGRAGGSEESGEGRVRQVPNLARKVSCQGLV